MSMTQYGNHCWESDEGSNHRTAQLLMSILSTFPRTLMTVKNVSDFYQLQAEMKAFSQNSGCQGIPAEQLAVEFQDFNGTIKIAASTS